ncbi:RICIN domain-containing protein [Streptomyces alboflavus]|uniref:RICIN domain-containing protein n=1 Tax=Streptomyces alboflavus TaxID=67267 RepID=UPI0004CCAFA6|nr:RICIN domain-containing protein [Streptomyces alboflavus]
MSIRSEVGAVRGWSAVITALAVMAALLHVAWGATPARAATTIPVDGAKGGRVFDGVGAVGGGGGNSRLLIDYPEPQRSQILDYLFKPGYGASLQVLKVEIGADTNSTNGAEPTHMRTRKEENYQRGYEWWLMKEAKKRNPKIKLGGLAWGAPGWIGGGDFWSQDMIDYLLKWVRHAKSDHGLTIDYLGGWNERGYDKSWYVDLKKALAADGLPTKIVGAETNWDVAADMKNDPEFRDAIDIVGAHYPGGYTNDGMGTGAKCPSTDDAVGLGKPLSASESGSVDYMKGGASIARGVNRCYLDGRMTSFISWPVVAALHQNMNFSTYGMLLADQPWSGNYQVGKVSWAMAHTAQFTEPGWQYIDAASGYLEDDREKGSYVTLKSPNKRDYSSVIETMDATSEQTADFTVSGGLSTGTVHVWATNMKSDDPAEHFVRQADVTPSGGSFSLTLKPGHLYSLTTTTGQGKGTATAPPRGELGLPYADSFDSTGLVRPGKYLSDMNGAFEVARCGGGRKGRCLRQMTTTKPIRWTGENYPAPYTYMGEAGWTNYTVSSDAMLEEPGYVQLLGRIGRQGRNNNGLNAYYLRVSDGGKWSILKSGVNGTEEWPFTTLAKGTVAPLGIKQWHKLSLGFQGSKITARIDGTTVGTVNDTTHPAGMIGYGVSEWDRAQFDNLKVRPGAPATNRYKIVNRNSGKSLAVRGGSTADGAPVVQWRDLGTPAQRWRLKAVGGAHQLLNEGSGKALEVPDASTTQGTQLVQATVDHGADQQWLLSSSGDDTTLTNRNSKMVADLAGGSTADGANVIQWPSSGGRNQEWTLVPVP